MTPPPRDPDLLSLVVPIYDEEENLPILIDEVRSALDPLGRAYEVLLVDDGSKDGGPAIMAAFAREDRRVRVVRLRRNCGQSAALAAGCRFARGAIVVTLDGDLQNDPRDIPRMLAELDRADVVCGVRANRKDDWVRRLSSKIANGVRNRLTREHVTDVGCTLRVARAEFLDGVPWFTGMHRFLPTLLRLEGATVTEIPVNHRPRLHGKAKYGIGNRLWRALADLFAVRWMQKRHVDRRLAEEIVP